jgi:hypothetical protein
MLRSVASSKTPTGMNRRTESSPQAPRARTPTLANVILAANKTVIRARQVEIETRDAGSRCGRRRCGESLCSAPWRPSMMNSRQSVGSSPRSIRLSISAWTFRSPPRPGRAYCVAVDAEGADQYRSVAQYAGPSIRRSAGGVWTSRMPSTGQPPGRQRHEPARALRFRDAVPAMIGRSPSGSRTALLSLRSTR